MSHIVTFDDRMLNDALSYARCLVKKLEAMEEPSEYVMDALRLMESVMDDLADEQLERFERKRGSEEAYRWRITNLEPRTPKMMSLTLRIYAI